MIQPPPPQKKKPKADQGLKVSHWVASRYVLNREGSQKSEMSHGITMVGFFGIYQHESIQLKQNRETIVYTENVYICQQWVASSLLQHASMWPLWVRTPTSASIKNNCSRSDTSVTLSTVELQEARGLSYDRNDSVQISIVMSIVQSYWSPSGSKSFQKHRH